MTHLPTIAVSHKTMQQTVAHVIDMINTATDCNYVVTPNLDHLRQLSEGNDALMAAYQKATLAIADGEPVRYLYGTPERVAGSNLVFELLDNTLIPRKLRVFLLGAEQHVGRRAAARLGDDYPGALCVGWCSPEPGFETSKFECSEIVSKINETKPDLLVIGLGCPKQEVWISEHYQKLNVPVAICAGSTIDMLAGEQRKAPRWVQRIKLEWVWRVLQKPSLCKRYALDAVFLAKLVWGMRRKENTIVTKKVLDA